MPCCPPHAVATFVSCDLLRGTRLVLLAFVGRVGARLVLLASRLYLCQKKDDTKVVVSCDIWLDQV